MTPRFQAQRGFLFVLMLLACIFSGCSQAKDPFSLTSRDVQENLGPTDTGYIDDGYAWGFGNLGAMLNGHGLPDQARTFVITHRSADGKTEVIWPVFAYGQDQANAVVLDHTVVFAAGLPDHTPVLMARREGEPPMIISPAVLRLAAKRLGTSVVMPDTDYFFTKVRLPPERVWLKVEPVKNANGIHPQGTFTLELTAEDLRSVVDETRSRAKLNHANKFDYLAETGSPGRISSRDAAENGATAEPASSQTTTAIYKTSGYTPQREELFGDVLLDAGGHYAYFSTHHEPGRILKVALGDDLKTPPTIVGAAIFEGEEDKPFNCAIDPAGGYAYFGTDFPAHLVKVALGSSNTPPYRVGSVLVDEDWNVEAGVLDAAGSYGCFQVGNRLVKFRLGKGDEPPAIVSQMDLPKDESNIEFNSAVFDPTTHMIYLGTDETKIYKVALGDGDAAPALVGILTLPEDDFGLRGAVIDSQNGYAWFTSQNGRFIKISLGEKDAPPRLIGVLKLGTRFEYSMHTFGADKDFAYLGTGQGGDAEGGVLKIALGKGDELPRIASFMPLPDGTDITGGIVNPDNHTLCLGVDVAGEGCKLLKLSLGDANGPTEIVATTPLFPK